MKYAVIALLTLIIGFLLRDCQGNDVITRTETVIDRDTVFQVVRDTVYRTQIKHTYERDTLILIDTLLVNLPINQFSEVFPVQYGSATVSGEVAGKVTKMSLATDFNIPLVTETKTVTITNIINPKGLYLGAGINSLFEPSIGAAYLNKGLLFNYDYYPAVQGHQIGVKKKIF